MLDIAHSQNGNVPVGQSKTALINESGLYSLILRSKLCVYATETAIIGLYSIFTVDRYNLCLKIKIKYRAFKELLQL